MTYKVQAYERGRMVCEVGWPTWLDAYAAVYFARDLREEFPDAVVAILPVRDGHH